MMIWHDSSFESVIGCDKMAIARTTVDVLFTFAGSEEAKYEGSATMDLHLAYSPYLIVRTGLML
jgi:hypothetical protein